MQDNTRLKRKKRLIGVVVSDKMAKSITVQVAGLRKHRTYKKYVIRSKKYKAHDEQNACRVGDKVLIEETRPISREKRWIVREILEKAV